MKYPKYSFIICVVFYLFITQTIQTHAQISEGGIPPSFSYEKTLRNSLATLEIPVTFNVTDLIRVDEWQVSEGIAPPCIATSIEVDLSPENSGQWSQLPTGENIWQLQLRAKDAIALILYYSDFYIPEGDKLYIYNAEKTQILGAYTHRTNPSGGRFATEMVAGDELTLEYVSGAGTNQPRIHIEAIGYGYNHIIVENNKTSLRASAYCEVNINCEEGDAWQNQKKGVCGMSQLIGSRTFVCTGSLVNNTALDLKPYILSATHCNSNNTREATPEEMKQWIFYFHKEYKDCSNSSGTVTPKTMVGCQKIASTATNGQSDGLLLLLNEPIPEYYNVYFNGWDRRDQPAQSGVGIHHPGGDPKKISTFKKPATHTTFSSTDGISGGPNAHWNAIFDSTTNGHGVTEGGSSGSPLFNQNKLIVGTLTGGSSTCSNPTGLNLYGKMGYHWNKYTADDSNRMDKWLDPINSGVETLEGRYADITNIYPPTELKAVYQQDKTILLTWEEPLIGEPVKYNIYNNNVKIGETTGFSYTDENPKTGTQLYSVSCTYENGSESNFTNTSVLVDEFKAPANVSATYTLQQKVAITWDLPLYEQTIYWGESKATYQVTIDGKTPFYFGQKWTKNEIQDFNKKKIKAVKFVPIRNNTYEVYISQGERIYMQKITNPTYKQTNTIQLTTPFVIDATKDLIVAFYISEESQTGKTDEYPAVCDGGPAVNGKGNIWSYDAKQWNTLYNEETRPGEFNYNFFVAAVVSSEEGEISKTVRTAEETTIRSSTTMPKLLSAPIADPIEAITFRSLQPAPFPEVTGYTIYRDGQQIATVNPTPRRYIDDEPNKKTEYQVAAAYYNEYEGILSDPVFIDPLSNELIDKETPVLYPTVFSNQVEIRGLYQVQSINVYDAKGKLYLHIDKPDNIINTQSLHAGIYFFRIKTGNGKDCTLRGVKIKR